MSRIDEALQRFASDRDSPAVYFPPASGPLSGARFREVDTSGDNDYLDLRELVRVLYRSKLTILAITLAVIAPVAVYNYLAEPLYRSTATIQIDPNPVQVLPFRQVDQTNLNTTNNSYDLFMRSQEEIFKGQTLASRVASRLEEGPETLHPEIERLWLHFSAERVLNTQLFHLSYTGPSPETAAQVANTYAEEYIKLHFEGRQQTNEEARRLLEVELRNLEARVQASETELLKYSQENDIGRADPNTGLVSLKRASLAQQVTAAEAEMFATRSTLDSLRQASVANFPAGLVTPGISSLGSQLLQLENELMVLRTSFGENWPEVVRVRGQVELVRDQLDREKRTVLAQALEAAALDYRTAENRRNIVAAALSEQDDLNHELQNATIQYNILQREVQTNQKMYDGILERLRETSVTAGLAIGGLQVIEPAIPSDKIDSPKVLWNLSLAAVLGFSLGICVVIGRHYWDTSMSTIEEVERATALPVLGSLPQLARGALPSTTYTRKGKAPSLSVTGQVTDTLVKNSPTPSVFSGNWEATEGIRNVVASILLSQSGRPPRILVVTSTVQGEGKTTLACELARALADSGAKTVLIDADLRRPALATRFGVNGNGDRGLSLFLSGNLDSVPADHPSGHTNLSVVTAGPSAPNPAALLGSEKMQNYIRDLLSSYQFIILDSPPVLPIADARILARMAEGVVLVIRAGRVPRALVRRASLALESSGANVFGAVLNGAEPNSQDFSSYYYDSSVPYEQT